MVSKTENERQAKYVAYFEKLTNDHTFAKKITRQFFDIEKKYRAELEKMQQLVGILKPTPSFLLFKGGKITTSGYSYHSGGYETLTRAIMGLEDGYGNGSFVTDAKNQVILAESNADVPVVTQFDLVIEANNAARLPGDHPAVRLSSLAHGLIHRIVKGGGSFEYYSLMLAEGVNENIDTILATSS